MHLVRELGLPPAKASTPDEFLRILQSSIKNFTLPLLKKKDKKGKGKGKKGKGKK